MGKFIQSIVAFSLKNRFFVFFMTALLIAGGVYSYLHTPIEAFPDVTNTQIIIVSQWPGRSAEEVERFVSTPIEVAMNSVQKKSNMRSISMFGLSVLKINFDDDVDDFYARQQVNNLLAGVSLPSDCENHVQPPYGPTGEIFRYTVQGKGRSTNDLLAIQDWVVERALKSVPGVADIAAFGGTKKVYEITADPAQLQMYNLTPLEVFQAVQKSNINVGGDVIEKNGQAYVVRGIGLLDNPEEIGNVIVDHVNGTPILVRNVARVTESHLPRVGQAGLDGNDDVIEGIVIMRKGENPAEVLGRVKAKIEELNTKVLPSDVKLVTFYDRDVLMDKCTETVIHNLIEGIVLVTLVVFLFMADWRSTLIVGVVVPLALLFAFICLRLKGMSANLLSMGAIDFGIIIDGAVVMVEGIFVVLDHKAHQVGMPVYNKLAKRSLIKKTGGELGKAVFFSKLIILTCLLPIFAFEKVEGKMFSPLAYTLGFALVGALLLTLTLVPVLASILLNQNVREKNNPIVNFFDQIVVRAFGFTMANKALSLTVAFALMTGVLYSFTFLGSEFLPELNEGALWVEAKLPMSSSLTATTKQVAEFRRILGSFPEVNGVLSQTGRSNDGTDPSGMYYVQCQVNLKPQEEWKRHITKEQLIDEMDKKLRVYPGVIYNYSQPIIDNVAEAVAGINASLAVKIFGNDLQEINAKADSVATILRGVRGVKDLGILRNLGQPEMSVLLDQNRMATYGVAAADAQAVVEMAIGGKAATQLYEGERKFDIRIRYPEQYRSTEAEIGELRVPTLKGGRVALKEIATIRTANGPASVYHDNGQRFIAVKFSVRDRDMGSTIAEAQKKVDAQIHLPKGYSIAWAGEFENQVRAQHRLSQMVPVALVIIFILLFITFGNAKDAGLVLVNVPFALIGGIVALHVTHTNFSISAGIGFIALFGICIQNGVILITVFKQNMRKKMSLAAALKRGVESRVRPVVMTALMAMIGLFPAALSTGIGSETQKPLAIVVIGGLVSATVLTLLIFPLIFNAAYKAGHTHYGDPEEEQLTPEPQLVLH
ncbi:efflux RND transporter permease subunit [Hymenobacter chitinivorans]|uniref:Cobalt-zinc-cadmium resistance protein CzcA n=1 Tax=Hymenobacter chitinivorans DSM 11115 TaxID=1121954 RepID=A0A2M9B4U0_9BACT|nr:CusA/CzcA family heavy metal efflux RND transporter [Hymenobacter chitinivorans]PJJ52951.1 cobalt-zinc-cadmium resistance protein CzcA [Hymenobacter chitinivorans DSM 11115]